MSALDKFKQFFAIPEQPELVQAQARVLFRQIPLLYSMLLANAFILGLTHRDSAPEALTLYVPLALAAVGVVRLIMWWGQRDQWHDYSSSRRLLKSMLWVAGLLSALIALWSIVLFQYGDAFQRAHVAFYVGITCIGCMFCLKHVRGASFLLPICGLAPFLVVFMASGNPVFVAIAINLMIVVAVLTTILLGNYRDFSALVASRAQMAQKQSETQRLSDENDRLANVDSLTGLPNRRWFERQLELATAQAGARGQAIAVARLDLDSFKAINDVFGRITGDRVLTEVANRINAIKRPTTFVARTGSDNFALIISGATDEAALQACGNLLTEAMLPLFDMPLGTVHLTASAGLAASRPGDTADTLFDRADYVTWVAKREARGHAVVFTDRHASDLRRVRKMEHALLTADLDAEISIVFQPQFDISLGRNIGYEVLARWCSPALGDVSPAEFIPMAERKGMISKITQAVLRKALKALEKLPEPLRLSVNLSANDIGSQTAMEAIVAMVGAAQRPCRIDFEITETAVMRDMQQANEALLVLLTLGARIALDDFGTGHSSLTHVQKLPLDRIKVDRSFVAEVTNDPASRAIIKTTVDLCRNLGISCVFEGIETEEQLAALLGMGATVMQGYLFGRPMSEDAMLAQLAVSGKAGMRRHKLSAAS